MIPNNLNEWDYQLIEKFVQDGFFETDKFDLKEDIPNRNDNSGKERLEKSTCSFANTEGGFLVFGIKNDRSLTYKDRIVGINSNRDFPREFGDKILNIEPHLYYDFRNPAIIIPNINNVIHVVKIEQSSERPHWTRKREFYFRTNRGNEPMNYQQVKDSFLGEEQRRQKLKLLFIELLTTKEICPAMVISKELISENYSLVTLDSTILQSLLVDIYPTIINNTELVKILIMIRLEINVMNNKIKIFHSEISLPTTGRKNIVKSHNEYINNSVQKLIPMLNRSMELLKDNYGLINPF